MIQSFSAEIIIIIGNFALLTESKHRVKLQLKILAVKRRKISYYYIEHTRFCIIHSLYCLTRFARSIITYRSFNCVTPESVSLARQIVFLR